MSYPADRILNRQIQQALYSLKRQYGGTVDIFSLVGSHVDPITGAAKVSRNATRVDRAIVLPVKVAREAQRSISAISANKGMVMGGYYDSGTRMFIIDRRDVPGLQLHKDDWLAYGNRQYSIDSIQEFEFDAAWVVIGKALIGENPGRVHHLYAKDTVPVVSAPPVPEVGPQPPPPVSVGLSPDVIPAAQAASFVLGCLRVADSSLTPEQQATLTVSGYPRDSESPLALGQDSCLQPVYSRSGSSLLAVDQSSASTHIAGANAVAYISNFTQGKLQAYTLTGTFKRSFTAVGPDAIQHVKTDAAAGHVYWLEASHGIYRKAASADYATPKSLVLSASSYPGLRALCIDPAAGKLYFARATSDPVYKIGKANLDGTGVVEYAFSQYVDVFSLVAVNGTLYGSILNASTNNRALVRFHSSDFSQYTVLKGSLPWEISGLTADASGGWLFYCSVIADGTKKYLYRNNLSGTNQQVVCQMANVAEGITYHADTNRLYWSQDKTFFSVQATLGSMPDTLHTGSESLFGAGIL
jgi:hypothetical protein